MSRQFFAYPLLMGSLSIVVACGQGSKSRLPPVKDFEGDPLPARGGDPERSADAGDEERAIEAGRQARDDPFEPCREGGNRLFLDGDPDHYVHPGPELITNASWSFRQEPEQGPAHTVLLRLEPDDSAQGLWWNVELSTRMLEEGLAEGRYEDARRYPFEPDGHPGLDVSGNGRGCNTVSGSFTIHELSEEAGTIDRLAATFVHYCGAGTAALRGCVRYAP